MTQDEIIEMAIKAELNLYVHDLTEKQYIEVIGTFAKLVADKERERLTDAAMKAAEKAVDVAIALEREACAKVADEYAEGPERNYSEIIADKIRARGQA